MWIKTGDRENQGTPFSYATETDDNALVITDYSGSVSFIHSEHLCGSFLMAIYKFTIKYSKQLILKHAKSPHGNATLRHGYLVAR